MAGPADIAALVAGVLEGKARAIAQSVSLIENRAPACEELIDRLYPHTGNAYLIGITGPPGSGKSTLVDKLIDSERRQNRKVAVIAVDPSSPFTGGALLGDRLRMQTHATDPDVFIRSMASRGHLGGVAHATGDAVKVFDAAGYDTIFIETIGVGQTEIQIVELADVVLLVLVPGMGDEIQVMKAGVMEIGDLFVVNKCDLEGADKLKTIIQAVLAMSSSAKKSPVLLTSATREEGLQDLVQTITGYLDDLQRTGLADKRKKRIGLELKSIFTEKVHLALETEIDLPRQLDEWIDQLYTRRARPYDLANKQMKRFIDQGGNP